MTMDLHEDPFLIEDWPKYCKFCLEQGEGAVLRSALCQYIDFLVKPIRDDLRAYAINRMGEWAQEDKMKEILEAKKVIEKNRLSRIKKDK